MTTTRWLLRGMAATLVAAAAPAWAQGRLDADAARILGGTYSPDCANPAAPRARVTAATLTVEQGSERMTGRNVQAAAAFFGASPPANYRTVLLGEVQGQQQLQFILFQDAAGYFLTLDGDPKVRAALGRTLLGLRYRQCGGSAKAGAPPPQVAAAPRPAQGGPAGATPPLETMTAAGLLMDPKFKAAWYQALGPRAKEPWLGQLDGPSTETKRVRVDGAEYFLGVACKNRDCGDNSMVVLYLQPRGVVYGYLHERGRATLVGNPPSAVAAELGRLWRKEWRQQN